MIDHRCLHEKEIILLVDHSSEHGEKLDHILKLLVGNGTAGIITNQRLQEQSLNRLWSLVKWGGGSFVSLVTVASVLVKFLGD